MTTTTIIRNYVIEQDVVRDVQWPMFSEDKAFTELGYVPCITVLSLSASQGYYPDSSDMALLKRNCLRWAERLLCDFHLIQDYKPWVFISNTLTEQPTRISRYQNKRLWKTLNAEKLNGLLPHAELELVHEDGSVSYDGTALVAECGLSNVNILLTPGTVLFMSTNDYSSLESIKTIHNMAYKGIAYRGSVSREPFDWASVILHLCHEACIVLRLVTDYEQWRFTVDCFMQENISNILMERSTEKNLL